MDEPVEPKLDSVRQSNRSRMIGKLFGREKKSNINNDDEVSEFLHGPSDKLYMTTSPVLSKLPKLDISNAHRWPTATEVNHSRNTSRRRSTSPKRSKKGLIVRFTDNEPEIIGEGGDEAESPTLEISARKRSYSHPPIIQRTVHGGEKVSDGWFAGNDPHKLQQGISPWPRSNSGTPSEAVAGLGTGKVIDRVGNSIDLATPRTSEADEHTRSNAASARMKAEMRAAEGRAFKIASQSFEAVDGNASSRSNNDTGLSTSALPMNKRLPPPLPARLEIASGLNAAQPSKEFRQGNVTNIQATAVIGGEAAFDEFTNRTRHLFILFTLSAESVSPINKSSLLSWIRAASWWFLKGRASIESAIRVRPSSPDQKKNYDSLRQQGHADVAKAAWIIRDILTSCAELKMYKNDDLNDLITRLKNAGDEYTADVIDRTQALTANLRMLSMSMQRNDCLPSPAEDAPLPQGLDTSIWVKYPSFPPEILSLLSGGIKNLSTDQGTSRQTKVSDTMPIGDTNRSFEYARYFVDVLLIGMGTELEQYPCPCIMFVSRARTDKNLTITLSSQNGDVALGTKASKESWLELNDIEWQSEMHAIDVKLPKDLIARCLFSSSDFTTLWNMYEYTEKVHASLYARKDEELVFESTFKIFQYIDRDPQSRTFPKEPIPGCQVRIFEKNSSWSIGRRSRKKYQGHRIAVVTGAKIKNLSGISQEISPKRPLQYSFMRGEGGTPALLLKFDDGIKKPTMVFTFDNISERVKLFSCITGGIRNNEKVVAYLPVKDYSLTYAPGPDSPAIQNVFDDFEWQGVQIINTNHAKSAEPDKNPAVQSDSLRIILDSKSGSVTDRINVEPGEMRIRLNTQLSTNEIAIFRQPQEDLSISLLESNVSKDVSEGMIALSAKISSLQTIRKLQFNKIEDLHNFQAAITGFSVLFDGIAETFVISRKRSVVSIHKKWEASFVRLQVLQYGKVVQIAVFFSDFKRGECMNFVVKATDVFESSSRTNKFYIRIVDAKFALPRGEEDNYNDNDKGFVCIDIPDYPGEHDDITIAFDSELARDNFSKTLPAAVKAVSKLGNIKR